MASVGMVERQPGPHRLDSEPQILLFKLHSSQKKKICPPGKQSWEKMVLECDSVAAGEERRTRPPSLAAAGGTVAGGRLMPGVPSAFDAPRSRSPCVEEGSDRVTAGTRHGHAGHGADGCDTGRDSSLNAGSLRDSGVGAMPNGPAANRRKKSHRHRDPTHARRSPRNGDGGQRSISSAASPPGEGGCLKLERLTQGRTGVVKLARNEPHRREAWSIFPRETDPRVRTERGEGHRFDPKPVKQDWCDACSRQISAQALKCQNCSYTCHLECKSQVQLDCNQRDKEPGQTPNPTSNCSTAAPLCKQSETKEEENGGTKELSQEEVRARIEEYNAQVSENGMNLATDGSYTGFIKVHLRLSRPVTVPALDSEGSEGGSRLAGAPSEGQDEADCWHTEKRTSFYLPCDCVKQVHISSLTTTREVIQGLLKKFMVLDNPRKFALYKQTHRDGQDLFQKLPLSERPLLLRLIAGPDAERLSFVLKENETGEVEWHAFSVPELQNFLVILQKEEAERIRAVEQKYAAYRQKLQKALQQHDP